MYLAIPILLLHSFLRIHIFPGTVNYLLKYSLTVIENDYLCCKNKKK